ncbi:diguanylate cyclase [Ningiella sp. W23]|uniref:diguanylate cyclase n=1 Tax=Ningiella sp. W23 TaxID=3023715 RepID=UPI0037576DE9
MSSATPKQQLMIARQHLDKLAIFINSMVDFFNGANPAIDKELKSIKTLLAGKPDYERAAELSATINSEMKKQSKYMRQHNLATLSQLQDSLRKINDLDAVDADTKSQIKHFIQSLAPESSNVTSPIAQFEKALSLFKQALSNNVVTRSQQDSKDQEKLHQEIIQELQELISPYHASESENKTIAELREKLQSGLAHRELLECCLVMIRFVMRDVIKEASTANKLINDIHKSLSKINVGIKTTIAKSKNRMQQRSAQNKTMRKQIDAIEATLSDSQRIEDLKREAQTHLTKMQSSLKASEADERAEQEKLIVLLESMQKRLSELEDKAQNYKQKLLDQRIQAMTDTLTKLPNRMAYEEKVEATYKQSKQSQNELCMAILDIDHFKQINDKYGHSVGDKTLQIIATQIKKNLNDDDFVARWGGEEFVALMPKSSLTDCFERLEAMREKISQLPFMFKGQRVSVTVSIGLTDMLEYSSIEKAFEQADALLYEAKQNGRNQTKIKDAIHE